MILIFGSIIVDVVPVPRLPGPDETVLGGDYQLLRAASANQAVAARPAARVG